MQVTNSVASYHSLLRFVLEPLFKYNPFFTLYYNPLIKPPQPNITSKPYYNYIHQLSILLDMIPRSRVRVLIGDEVGLGKTIEALRIIKYLLTIGRVRKVLIIAPRLLLKQWFYHDIRELLYAPGCVKRVTRETIERIRASPDSGDVSIYLAPIDLVKRGSFDKHSWGSYKPYYDFISSVKWDLVVVDEAHQLGFTRTRSLRTERIAPICEKAENLILLSATPSRGTHEDMLGRISLLIPESRDKIVKMKRRDERERRRLFYRSIQDYFVYRRTKDFVNIVENKSVFTNLTSFLAVVKLGDLAKYYDDLGRVLSIVLRSIGETSDKSRELVRIIILKRALSSPYAFLKTLNRVLGDRSSSTVDLHRLRIPSEEYIEKNIDNYVEDILRAVSIKLRDEIGEKLAELIAVFKEMYDKGDPVFKAIAYLINLVVDKPSDLPRELVGDYIIFSEYRDTVDYLYSKLIDFFTERGFVKDYDAKNRVVSKSVEKYLERRLFDERSRRYIGKLQDSVEILRSRDSKWLFIAKISSWNKEIVYLIPDLVEVLRKSIGERVVKVIVSTDIASEGLNLQDFNIVVNYDISWSPVRREQRVGRVYRLRQVRDCTVVDIVRDVSIDYEFYRKLLLKLLEMTEQGITTKPIEGLIELYIVKGRDESREYLYLSERDVLSTLCRVYEEYYSVSRQRRVSLHDLIDDLKESLKRELGSKILMYKELVEEFIPKYSDAEYVRNYVRELTGCENHDCFMEIITKLYEVVTRSKCVKRDASGILVYVYEELFRQTTRESIDSSFRILVRDPAIVRGYIGIVDLLLGSEVRYSTPVLVLYRDNSVEVIHGLDALKWIVDKLTRGEVLVVKQQSRVSSGEFDEFRDRVSSLVRRLNYLLTNRFHERTRHLSSLFGSHISVCSSLDARVEPVVVKITSFTVQSISEYMDYLSKLPSDIKTWMERESVKFVEKYFAGMNCKVVKENIGVPAPYDLLIECPGEAGLVKYMVEVKSHLKRVFVAELTPSETELAEKNPNHYIVCNVANMECDDKSSWILLCGVYEKLRKDIRVREERYAVIDFSTYSK